jgi:hypothetical protein
LQDRISNRADYVWLLIVPVLLLAGLLAARSLNVDAIWFDEYWTLKLAGSPPYHSRSLIGIWNNILATYSLEPPGYYMLVAGWSSLAGWTPFANRALSWLFGLLAIATMYRLGRDMFSPVAGLGAAVALGLSAFFLDYLHDIRNYAVFAFLTAFVIWTYWRIMSQRGGRVMQAAFVIAVAAFMYLHYYAVVPLAAIALYHLLFVPKGREWWRVVILMGLGGVLFLPWVGGMLVGLEKATGDGANYVIPTLTVEQAFRVLLHAFSNGSVPLFGLMILIAFGIRQKASQFVWLSIVVIFGLMMLVNARLEILINIRHLMALWPLLALVVGMGVWRLAKGGIHPALPLAIWIATGVGMVFTPAFLKNLPNTEPRLDRVSLDTTLDVLKQSAQPDDVIVFHVAAGDDVLGYYLHDLPVRFKHTDDFWAPEPEYATNVHNFVAEANHVWYVTGPDMPPYYQQDEFFDVLNQEHVRCDRLVDLPGMQLERYARIPAEAGPYQFDEGIRLTLLDPIPESATGHLPLLLGWSLTDDVPRQKYSVGLHVENADGQLVAQSDYGLTVESFACAASDIALDGLPPGEYTLLALVYDWQTNDRLPAENMDSGETGDRLPLGTIQVNAP